MCGRCVHSVLSLYCNELHCTALIRLVALCVTILAMCIIVLSCLVLSCLVLFCSELMIYMLLYCLCIYVCSRTRSVLVRLLSPRRVQAVIPMIFMILVSLEGG